MDLEVISHVKELTDKYVKLNYEVEKKDAKVLVVFATNACEELSVTSQKIADLQEENKALKDYVQKVVKFLTAPDTIQPMAKDFVTFLLAKAKAFK